MKVETKVTLTPQEKEVMAVRCEEDGHAWVNCCSPFLQVYMRCKWCEAVR